MMHGQKEIKSIGKNFRTVQLSMFLNCDWRIWRFYCSMVHCVHVQM